jgi:predicted AAA+ superfamily ATPase
MIDKYFPHTYTAVFEELRKRVSEPAPGFVQLLSGPRQVGKTTILLALAKEYGEQSIYVAADSPEASLPGWWEQVWKRAELQAEKNKAILLIDEVHYLPRWSALLKVQYDRIRRLNIPLHCIVTGSSAMQLGAASRETMAGRFERLKLLHWPAAELARRFKLKNAQAVDQLLAYGSYPGSIGLLNNPLRWQEYIRSSIIEPAIGRDILVMETVRKPALMRQVFAVSVGYPAEIVAIHKIAGQLLEKGAVETIVHYLHLLEEASLIASIKKYTTKKVLLRASPPKLVVLNQALFAAIESQLPPTVKTDPVRYGRWVENACIAHAWNAGQKVWYWREEPLEVDMVLEGSWGTWAIEIKTGTFTTRDLAGLLTFCKKYPRFKPLVICLDSRNGPLPDAGIQTVSLQSYLLEGLN